MNVFQRVPIQVLQGLIGESQLTQIESILQVLEDDGGDPALVYSRKFLADYVYLNITVGELCKPDVLGAILNALSSTEFEELLLALGIKGDSRESLERQIVASAARKPFRKGLLVGLGLSHLLDTDVAAVASPTVQNFERNLVPFKQLKDYQFEVYFDSVKLLKAISSRFVVQMPTGSGKTRTAMEIVSQFLNENPDATVIWIAHSTELCEQACQCFSEVWPHLARHGLVLSKFFGQHKLSPVAETKSGFFCSTFQSLYGAIKRPGTTIDSHFHKKRLVVVDEAHKAIANTYRNVVLGLVNTETRVIGLTATPGRAYKEDDSNQELSDFFFNDLVTFNPNGMNAIEYLRGKGVLSKARLDVLNVGGQSYSLTASELKSVSEFFEIPHAFLKKLSADTLRNTEIVAKLMKLINSGQYKSIIYFGTSLDQSRLVNSILKFFHVKSEHVDGSSSPSFRASAIERFKTQEINVLCNYEVLSTGFDAPLVDCVFIARPTASVVLYSQMVGRGLRGPEIGGKANCLVVNVKDNITNLPSIDSMFDVFVDYWVNA